MVPMGEIQIRYDDGVAYERMMGSWSRAAGELFLDWLGPSCGLRWIDVGCGTGAFTELLIERCAPAEVEGVDPSEAQLSFARARSVGQVAKFQQGDALALPFSDVRFDAAVMALVIFFVPDPAKGVAEMGRVVCPGGTVAAYVWDMMGGGHPLELMHIEMNAMGFTAPQPPRSDITGLEALRRLWRSAAFDEIQTRQMAVQRRFLILRTIGRPAGSQRPWAKRLQPWAQPISNSLRLECARSYLRMQPGASPVVPV